MVVPRGIPLVLPPSSSYNNSQRVVYLHVVKSFTFQAEKMAGYRRSAAFLAICFLLFAVCVHAYDDSEYERTYEDSKDDSERELH